VEFADFQASSTFELDGKVLSACEKCQMDHAGNDPPTEPPCSTCRVDLLPENEDAGRIYRMIRGQVITRHNGKYDTIMDLNHVALWAAIDGYRIRDRIGCFEKVLTTFHHFQNEGSGDEA